MELNFCHSLFWEPLTPAEVHHSGPLLAFLKIQLCSGDKITSRKWDKISEHITMFIRAFSHPARLIYVAKSRRIGSGVRDCFYNELVDPLCMDHGISTRSRRKTHSMGKEASTAFTCACVAMQAQITEKPIKWAPSHLGSASCQHRPTGESWTPFWGSRIVTFWEHKQSENNAPTLFAQEECIEISPLKTGIPGLVSLLLTKFRRVAPKGLSRLNAV